MKESLKVEQALHKSNHILLHMKHLQCIVFTHIFNTTWQTLTIPYSSVLVQTAEIQTNITATTVHVKEGVTVEQSVNLITFFASKTFAVYCVYPHLQYKLVDFDYIPYSAVLVQTVER